MLAFAKIHDPRTIRLLEVLLHGGSHVGGWTAKQIHDAVLTTFHLSNTAYRQNQLRYDLRKGHGGPFLTGLVEVFGLKRTVLLCMGLLIAGTGLSSFMTTPWQLFFTWGFMVGIGSGAGAFGIAAAVANRWFEKRNGLAMGLLTAANAAGQLVFLPLLAMLADQNGWQTISIVVTLAVHAPYRDAADAGVAGTDRPGDQDQK
jgi:hypothetical protein